MSQPGYAIPIQLNMLIKYFDSHQDMLWLNKFPNIFDALLPNIFDTRHAVSAKIICLVLISVEHHIKISLQVVFSFQFCLEVVSFSRYSLFYDMQITLDVTFSRILNTSYILQSEKYYSS